MKKINHRVKFDENSYGIAIFVCFCRQNSSYKLLIIRDIDGQLCERWSKEVTILLEVP